MAFELPSLEILIENDSGKALFCSLRIQLPASEELPEHDEARGR